MEIRHSEETDIPRMMEIYERARRFMADTGNPRQWGARHWPPEELIRRDIAGGKSYVAVDNGKIVGTFFFDMGEDIEPTYRVIEGGSWSLNEPYGVVHRIASDGSVRGTGEYCISWALKKAGYLRIDTHQDNKVMRNLLKKMGFSEAGTIYVVEDDDPRLAFEKKCERGADDEQ